MSRPNAIVRGFMAIVSAVERLNLKYSAVGNPPIYDNATFPWATDISRYSGLPIPTRRRARRSGVRWPAASPRSAKA